MALTEEMVVRAQRQDDDRWHVGNQVLYNLCRDCPDHVDDATIVAKVWLIGRAYSASIERGRPKGLSNDRFYTEAVPAALRQQKYRLDDNLKALAELKEVDESSMAKVLETHGHLVRCFKKLTTLSKRSLASKYLHFHLPNLFFIYDSRAASTIRSLPGGRHTIQSPPLASDPEYAKFVGAALGVREHVVSKFKRTLSPREIDRLLLATFASADP